MLKPFLSIRMVLLVLSWLAVTWSVGNKNNRIILLQ